MTQGGEDGVREERFKMVSERVVHSAQAAGLSIIYQMEVDGKMEAI